MSAYIDDGEKFVARLGGTYAPAAKKAPKSLELTDRRIYFSTSGKLGKTEHATSSVIDAADVSAVTYVCERPRGSFGLGIFLLVMAAIVGAVIGCVSYFTKEEAKLIQLLLPICLGVGIGILALVLCYIITWLIAKKHREVVVSIEYRGLILSTSFYGINDDKLEEFRRWTMRVKDKLVGRKAPPLPESSITPDLFDEPIAAPLKEKKDKEKNAPPASKAEEKKAAPSPKDL